jgi:cell wall-associated NlpC family hydrolase
MLLTQLRVGAQEPFSSIEGPASIVTLEEFDPDAVILLIQDVNPWIGGNTHTALHDLNIPHDVINSPTLSKIDLSKYKVVIYSSAQPYSYYTNLRNNLDKISTFVSNGGLLIAHCCDGGWDGSGDWRGFSILPGGITHLIWRDDWKYLSQSIHILEPDHPVVVSKVFNQEFTLTDEYLNGWGWSTHGIFTNFPPDDPKVKNPKVVMASNEGDGGDGPTYIDYNYGLGKVLATMQTIEWGYFSGSRWWVGNRPEFLRNELRFAKRIFPEEAATLATKVIGKGYAHVKGYKLNENYQFLAPEDIQSLDCSGLSFWSYNRAYYGNREIKPSYAVWEKTPRERWKEGLWDIKWENRPMYYFGANGQWKYNVKPLSEWKNVEKMTEDKVTEIIQEIKSEVKPGDLLFFDTEEGGRGVYDHVAMYIGRAEMYVDAFVEYKYIVVHAHGGEQAGISQDTIDNLIKTYWSLAQKKEYPFTWLSIGVGRVKDHVIEMKIVGGSPIDLIVTDPDGEVLTKEIGDTFSMEYMEYDIDGDGKLNDIIASGERKIGDYQIQVVPEPGALPTDTYSLEVIANGETFVLAENVSVANIPSAPYIIRSTETEIIPIIPATVDFDPNTLNLKSKGNWVSVYIELPIGHDYNISMINVTTVMLNNQIYAEAKLFAIGDYDNDGILDIMVKFNRKAIQAIFEVGEQVKVTISGKLIDGRIFEGRDTIKVISPP